MVNAQGKFKSSLLPVMLVLGVVMAVLVIAQGFSPGFGTAAKMNITNISVVGKLVGTGSGTNAFTITGINVSGTMFFNITMNSSNGTVAGNQSGNITNISLMFRHANNLSVMGNFTATNSTVSPAQNQGMSPIYWNISVDTTTLPDGFYTLFALVNNFTNAGTGTGAQPHANATLAINVSIDNSPPNVSIPADTAVARTFNRSLTVADANQSFNATVQDASFWFLHGSAQPNGSNVENVTFVFDNASTDNTFNVTLNFGSGATSGSNGGQSSNMSAANTSALVWQASLNITTFKAGEHTVRVRAFNRNGVVNASITFNFTVNTAHNVTYMSKAGDTVDVVTQFANFSKRNTSIQFNVSVINATGLLRAGYAGAPVAPPPIFTVIAMFDNASGNDFNLSNGTNRVSDLNIAGVGYWNLSYNVSQLEEGNNTVTFFVNDTHGNHNKTTQVSFFVDKTAPSLTITCSPSEPKEGETVSCTCSASDSGTGLKSDAAFFGGTKSESTKAVGIGQQDTSLCSAEDYVGNRNEKRGSYNVVSAASGGSGGGGSGGGASSSVGSSGAKTVWASINAGEVAKIVTDKPGLAVTAVEVKVDQTVYGAWIQVKSVEKTDLPATAATKLAGKVYDLIEITENKMALKESVVSERTVNFKVEKSWLSQNGLDKSDVALLRYNSDEWTALSTTATSEDAVNVEYKATVPGFSFFAVGEKSAATAVAPSPGEEGAEPTPAPTTGTTPTTGGDAMMKEEGGSLTWLWVVLVLAVLAGAVYYAMKRK